MSHKYAKSTRPMAPSVQDTKGENGNQSAALMCAGSHAHESCMEASRIVPISRTSVRIRNTRSSTSHFATPYDASSVLVARHATA